VTATGLAQVDVMHQLVLELPLLVNILWDLAAGFPENVSFHWGSRKSDEIDERDIASRCLELYLYSRSTRFLSPKRSCLLPELDRE
jgi:hypothetical protein